jgi:hypothetical protein
VGDGVGDGVGDVVGDGVVEGVEEPPQAAANIKTADITTRRNENIRSSDVPNLRTSSNIPR